ncbi:MAG: DUF1289 domain-containing protein [Rhodanobacteraceae bacterium]
MQSSRSDEAAPLSPCVGICRMGVDGLCIGCRRTLAEIAQWGTLSNEERQRWMRDEQPRRPSPRA